MKVFCDYHHGGLYHALHLLFEVRLGMELYRPIGMEWAEKGIWQYSTNPPTQRQYLDPVNCELRKDGYYYWRDTSEEVDHRCLTFEQFKETDIDLILATVWQHTYSFKALQQVEKPRAKYIRLCGNSGEPMDWSVHRNLIDTTNLYQEPSGCNRVVVHQEFPVDLFYFQPPLREKKIRSYLNCFNETPYYPIFFQYKEKLPEFDWKIHGLNGPDGFITPVSKLAQSMRESSFIWHIKQHGEGFGHIIHNAFAVGRPTCTVKEYYQGKLIYPMLEDGITCLDLGSHTLEENCQRIKELSEPEKLLKMSETCRKRFLENVSFDKDEQKMRQFLSRLL